MKKTILTFASAVLLVTVTVNAKTNAVQSETASVTNYVTYDLSSFCKAIMQGDIETVKRMIELGEDINKKSLGMTPAIFAARYNKAEILELLIANGANLKIKSDKGFTAKKYAELSNAKEALAVLEAAQGS
ncbi:MAG: ankyrin repeat domain-containing protein [Bacteroidota bacterium]